MAKVKFVICFSFILLNLRSSEPHLNSIHFPYELQSYEFLVISPTKCVLSKEWSLNGHSFGCLSTSDWTTIQNSKTEFSNAFFSRLKGAVILTRIYNNSDLASTLIQLKYVLNSIQAALIFLPILPHEFANSSITHIKIKSFSLTSNIYLCTLESLKFKLTNEDEWTKNFFNLQECFELYTIKYKTIFRRVEHYDYSHSDNQSHQLHELIESRMRRRTNYFNIPIIAAVMKYTVSRGRSTFKRKANYGNSRGEVELQSGLEVDLYRDMKHLLNFREMAVQSDGYLKEGLNHSLNNSGLALSLNSGKADISISLGEFLPYRMRGQHGIRYLHPSLQSRISAFLVQPTVHQVRNIFFMPFTLDLWIAIGITTILLSITVWLALLPGNRKWAHSPSSYLLLILSRICQRGYYYLNSECQPVLVILLTVMITSQILYSGYTSAMFSILSYPVFPIKSLLDLLDKNFIIYVDLFIPTLRTRIEWLQKQNSFRTDLHVEEIAKLTAIPLLFSSPSSLLTTTDEFDSAFTRLNITYGVDCAKISKIAVPYSNTFEGMFVKRDSPFRDHFNSKLLLIRERGLENRYLRKHFKDSVLHCVDLDETKFHSVEMYDIGIILLFLFITFSASYIILLAEACTKQVSNRYRFFLMNL